jgi:DNA (cytosine-5)-methyltransferase 3A
MACGMIAFKELGINIESYDAFEIDKYAIKVSTHNFPEIKQHGDVFKGDFTQFEGVDWVIGGSPCTHWSIAQKNNRETTASGIGWELFQQYVRAIKEAKPKYFLYENNKSMSKEIRASIDEAFGFEAVLINSALVSAQNRQRLYWVGKRNDDGTYSKVDVEQPKDKGILLRDVLDNAVAWQEKSYALTTRCQGVIPEDTLAKRRHTMAAEPVNITPDGKSQTLKAQYQKNNISNFCCYSSTYGASGVAEPLAFSMTGTFGNRNASVSEKAYCLAANPSSDMSARSIEPVCVAQRGRYSYTEKRCVNGEGVIEQFYEARTDGKTNALTTVQKDNAVAEPIRVGCYPSPDGTLKNSQGMRLYSVDGKAVSQTANGGGMGAKTGLYAIPCCSFPVREATKKGYAEIEPMSCVDMTQPNSKTRRGRNMADKANCCMTSCQYYQYCGVLAYATPCEWDENGNVVKAISASDGKTYTVYEVKDGYITIKGKSYPIKLIDGYYIIRKLTVNECKRLQTVPDWYDFSVISKTQAYKCLGNGWTCDVITHLIKSALNQKTSQA